MSDDSPPAPALGATPPAEVPPLTGGRVVALGVHRAAKAYKGIRALDDVTVAVHHRESLALLGANGAGKSTLVRILTGAVSPDYGEVVVDGHLHRIASVREARHLGIGYVPQELTIAPELTVAENVLAAGWEHTRGFVRTRRSVALVDEVCAQVGLARGAATPLRRLSPAEHRLVMIARALVMRPRTMILDEPTAALAEREAERIVDVLTDLRRRGISLIYISHRMGEISRLCDSLVVLRDGRVVMSGPATPANVEQAVAVGMAGRVVAGQQDAAGAPAGPSTAAAGGGRREAAAGTAAALRCVDLRTAALRDVSLEVGVGEIVGLAGLLGSGRTETLRAVAGADRVVSGRIEVFGKPVSFRSPADGVRAGVALLPEDRRGQGGLLSLSIADNLVLADIPRRAGGLLNRRSERSIARDAIERFGIKCQSADMALQSLSGGNQQKVILARWLLSGARLLLLDEPTAGIDVVAKAEILAIVTRAVEEGRGALVVSSELSELCELCDRIYVLRNGRVVDCVPGGGEPAALARLCGESAADRAAS